LSKKGKIKEKIWVRIIRNSSYVYYQIKVYNDYKNGKTRIKSGEEYICDSELLKKIKEKTWKAIIKKKQ